MTRRAGIFEERSAESIEQAGDLLRKVGLTTDRPLVLCRVASTDEMFVAKLGIRARDFWRSLGLSVQVLVLNDKSGPEADMLQRQLKEAISLSSGGGAQAVLRHADTLRPEEQHQIQEAAHLVLTGENADILRVGS